jgi:hypothetical protein
LNHCLFYLFPIAASDTRRTLPHLWAFACNFSKHTPTGCFSTFNTCAQYTSVRTFDTNLFPH